MELQYNFGASYSEGLLELDEAVGLHLQYELNQEFDESFIPVAMLSLQAVAQQRGDEWIELPTAQGHYLTHNDIVEWLHLKEFLYTSCN